MSAPDPDKTLGHPMRMREKIVLRVVSKGLIPLILLFALYVQFHGDFGPGGGFQAGVIFGAGFILYGIIFDLDAVQKVFPPLAVEIGTAAGVLLYGGVGIAGLLLDGNFLDYHVLAAHHVEQAVAHGAEAAAHASHVVAAAAAHAGEHGAADAGHIITQGGDINAHGQHLGILLVELGVGITVTCSMVAIFYFFAGRAR
jgi:multicomponent Na+:H+ antiporter subunit B